MITDHTSPSQHVGNILAAILPTASFLARVNIYLASIITIAGLCWYTVLFYDRFVRDPREEKRKHEPPEHPNI